jgi:ketosteroid isomerase-like protein
LTKFWTRCPKSKLMSNTEFMKNLYEAFAKGDVPTVLQSFDENIEWTEAEGFPYGGIYHGGNAIVENVFMKLATEWEGYTVTPDDFLEDGERVVALGHYSGKYIATGKSMHVPFAHVWTIADGKVKKFVQYTDTLKVSEAL